MRVCIGIIIVIFFERTTLLHARFQIQLLQRHLQQSSTRQKVLKVDSDKKD